MTTVQHRSLGLLPGVNCYWQLNIGEYLPKRVIFVLSLKSGPLPCNGKAVEPFVS